MEDIVDNTYLGTVICGREGPKLKAVGLTCSLPWGSATTQPRSGAVHEGTQERPITARGGSGNQAARRFGRAASLAETSQSGGRGERLELVSPEVGTTTRPSSGTGQSARGGSSPEPWRSGALADIRPSGWRRRGHQPRRQATVKLDTGTVLWCALPGAAAGDEL